MEIIEELKKKIKICNCISITALILIVICMIAEFAISQLMSDKAAAARIINNIAYFCYVLPLAVMLPLFFKVNFKNKLSIELKKKES